MAAFWEELRGTVLDGRFPLGTIVQSSPDHAEFTAGDATVTLFTAGDDAGQQLESMQDACRLHHPNLLRLLGCGRISHAGTDLLYIASEKPEVTLEQSGPLTPGQRVDLESGINAALEYLHQHDLAYHNVSPSTIVMVKGDWQLADYGSIGPLSPEAITADRRAFAELLAPPRWTNVPAAVAENTRAPQAWRVPRFAVALGGAAALVLVVWAAASSSNKTGMPPQKVTATERPSPIPTAKPRVVETAMQTSPRLAPPAPAPVKPPSLASAGASLLPAGAGTETGRASFFSPEMNGHQTASGERINSDGLTAAHRSYPMGMRLKVTNVANGKSVVVRVNDRGAFGQGQSIIVSPRAARELGFVSAGSAAVRVEPVQ